MQFTYNELRTLGKTNARLLTVVEMIFFVDSDLLMTIGNRYYANFGLPFFYFYNGNRVNMGSW